MVSFDVALLFGLAILLIHFFSDKMQDIYIRHKKGLVAFSGGVTLSYLFLYIFPAIYQVQGRLSKVVFVSVLIGLGIFFILDRHISRHKMPYKVKAEIREEHAVALFIYHILIGIAFVGFSASFADLLIFFVPIALLTAFSSVSMIEVYEIEKENTSIKAILSTSTLIGMILASIIPISRLLYFPLLGLIGGSLLYLIMNDVIREPERKSFYFFWGMLAYGGIIGVIWWLF